MHRYTMRKQSGPVVASVYGCTGTLRANSQALPRRVCTGAPVHYEQTNILVRVLVLVDPTARGMLAADAPVAESTYDPNCKILCGGPGQGCLKLTGRALQSFPFSILEKHPGPSLSAP